MHEVRRPLAVVLLPGAALLLVDGVALALRQAEEAADHGQVLPQRPVLRRGVLLPAQQLTEPALEDGDGGGGGGEEAVNNKKKKGF